MLFLNHDSTYLLPRRAWPPKPQEMLNRTRTYSFGSICLGSLVFGVRQAVQGLSSFLERKRVPCIPSLLNLLLFGSWGTTSWAYVYVGLYGYSFTKAGENVNVLFRNKGFDDMAKNSLAGNVLFIVNTTIGLLTGFAGFMMCTFEYRAFWRSGLNDPTTDAFV